MLRTPEELERAWGVDSLVKLPPHLAAVPLSVDTLQFLLRPGLPTFIRFFPGYTEGLMTFCRLASGPAQLLAEKTVGPPLPQKWSVYWIIGDEFFCNGSAWWCVHAPTGRVDRIDIEIEHQPISFVNTSVAHFASALLAIWFWSAHSGRIVDRWPSEIENLKRELAVLDPPCMQSDKNFWPVHLDFLGSEGPQFRAFEKGSLAEGEAALKAGSW
jgi:SUKH-4 immunity protein